MVYFPCVPVKRKIMIWILEFMIILYLWQIAVPTTTGMVVWSVTRVIWKSLTLSLKITFKLGNLESLTLTLPGSIWLVLMNRWGLCISCYTWSHPPDPGSCPHLGSQQSGPRDLGDPALRTRHSDKIRGSRSFSQLDSIVSQMKLNTKCLCLTALNLVM